MKKLLFISLGIFSLFLLLIVLLSTVDVQTVYLGLENYKLGFYSLNTKVASSIGVNDSIYLISDILGYLAILVCASFGFVGFLQLVKRKKLFDVDVEILSLGIIYIITIAFYVFFIFVAVNNRPILIDNELESSFPSSHTVLAIVVYFTAWLAFKNRLPKKINYLVLGLSLVLCIASILTRFLSGYHWTTDIIGSFILGSFLIVLYLYIYNKLKSLLRK